MELQIGQRYISPVMHYITDNGIECRFVFKEEFPFLYETPIIFGQSVILRKRNLSIQDSLEKKVNCVNLNQPQFFMDLESTKTLLKGKADHHMGDTYQFFDIEFQIDHSIQVTDIFVSGFNLINTALNINYSQHTNITVNTERKLSPEDQKLLKSNKCATDSLISFFLGKIISEQNISDIRNVFVFGPEFMNMLTANGKNSNEKDVSETVSRMSKWGTYKEDDKITSALVDKDYVLIIVNDAKNHWLLYTIYKPFTKSQCALMFVTDSAYGRNVERAPFHQKMFVTLSLFFDAHNELYGPNKDIKFDFNRGFNYMKCPIQTDVVSCAFHVLLCVRQFLSSESFRKAAIKISMEEIGISFENQTDIFSDSEPLKVIEFKKTQRKLFSI